MLQIPQFREPFTSILLILLAAFVIYWGIIPAFTVIDSDFPNYYTAGRIASQGTNIEKLYDDAWFQEQIHANGLTQQGKFSPFPPPTALLFMPLAPFSPLAALRIFTVINILALLAAIVLLAQSCPLRFKESALLVLLSGVGLANCFRLGQLYILVSCSIILGYYLFKRKQMLLAGVAFGLTVPVKYYPVIFVLYFAWMKEWKVVLGSLIAIFSLSLLSVAILGREVHEIFLQAIPGGHLQGTLSMQNPFSASFQSFESLLKRLFVFDADYNPAPLVNSTGIYLTLKVLIVLALVGITLFLCRQLQHLNNTDCNKAVIGLIGILGLLIAPATGTYHFVLFWLPIGLLLTSLSAWQEHRTFRVVMCVYGLIGFIPYSVFRQCDGRGILSVFAYPRLFFVLLLFATAVYAIYAHQRRILKQM